MQSTDYDFFVPILITITIISTQKFLITITIMIIFLNHFWLRLNYDYRSINFSDYNYDYEKIYYNRNRVIIIIIDPNPGDHLSEWDAPTSRCCQTGIRWCLLCRQAAHPLMRCPLIKLKSGLMVLAKKEEVSLE
jgi:hypothetical protein